MRERLVVSDTSPLLYLHQIRQLDLLISLFGIVVVGPDELRQDRPVQGDR